LFFLEPKIPKINEKERILIATDPKDFILLSHGRIVARIVAVVMFLLF
jgi:hypothetical protein